MAWKEFRLIPVTVEVRCEQNTVASVRNNNDTPGGLSNAISDSSKLHAHTKRLNGEPKRFCVWTPWCGRPNLNAHRRVVLFVVVTYHLMWAPRVELLTFTHA